MAAALAIPFGACAGDTETLCSVQSPDGSVSIDIRMNDSALEYGVSCRRGPDWLALLTESRMGVLTDGSPVPSDGWSAGKVRKGRHRGIWKPVWGKRAVVPDNYNHASVTFSKGTEAVTVELRAYDDGVAFRYVKSSGPVSSWEEMTDFNFAGDFTAWYYNGERHNIGPEQLSAAAGDRMPVMTVKAADDVYMAVHEACLMSGKPLLLRRSEGLRFDVVSEPVEANVGYESAWRVVMVGSTPGSLVDSHLIELLNPNPAPDADFSWVRPGIYLWDWRINGAVWDGYRYSMSYDSWVRMVDFAEEAGFAGLVLDANWYGPEFEKDSDPTKGDKARDVQRIIRYAAAKGVGVWLYLNDVAGTNYPIEATLEQYEQWGATGVKYGFMNGSYTEKNLRTRMVTELCAKHHLMVDFHDYPVHPWGQSRTWPNAVTREYCQAQLDGHHVFYPKTFVTSVFVNMIAGPVDMNNGFLDLRQGRTTRVDNNQEVPSTVAAEAARTLITYSGASVIPDIPEYYRMYPALLDFFSSQRQPWLESRTLDGAIGEYIVMMRQPSDGTYLIGAATNEEGRALQVPLDFLPKGEYSVVIAEDGEGADYRTSRETLSVNRQTVSVSRRQTPVLTLRMAPGGGSCVKIVKTR